MSFAVQLRRRNWKSLARRNTPLKMSVAFPTRGFQMSLFIAVEHMLDAKLTLILMQPSCELSCSLKGSAARWAKPSTLFHMSGITAWRKRCKMPSQVLNCGC
ncbi:hypothetical protein AVEN_56505-1 [Araneus ventricosus]|uniref:Uncharacterized protein n=1 Tax=Araneus ventricosus TaxID=182803 RepID=A0A4Y2K0E8_ARAVE|nr:hypothetical protein AVEN_56505-1 [Araneus ventricosus]